MSCEAARKAFEKRLKQSLVPLPCQECQLNASSCTNSESIEWLDDLEGKPPLWSRLNEINTSGYRRKLPMSMTKNYDIEIDGRLWSLWGHEHKVKFPPHNSKSYMGITVMALCAARAINLNIWNTDLMNSIRVNGRKFFKKSLKSFNRDSFTFELEDLGTECSLDSIAFDISMKTILQGYLYTTPLQCQLNLAYALIQFFNSYKFGLLECCKRVLGFGLIDGPKGGYYMFDAQSYNHPIFAEGRKAPYLLRTNHLQVLLYCIVVSLNVHDMCTPFCLHHVQINLLEQSHIEYKHKLDDSADDFLVAILPNETYKVPIVCLKSPGLERVPCSEILAKKLTTISKLTVCKTKIIKDKDEDKDKVKDADENEDQDKKKHKHKYERRPHNITKEKVETSVIKPMVDPDRGSSESYAIKNDFIRIICSNTEVGLTSAEKVDNTNTEFTYNLIDALMLGKLNCVVVKDF